MSTDLQQLAETGHGQLILEGLRAWANNEIYIDGQGNYRWSQKTGKVRWIAPFSKALKHHFPSVDEIHQTAQKLKNQETTP